MKEYNIKLFIFESAKHISMVNNVMVRELEDRYLSKEGVVFLKSDEYPTKMPIYPRFVNANKSEKEISEYVNFCINNRIKWLSDRIKKDTKAIDDVSKLKELYPIEDNESVKI